MASGFGKIVQQSRHYSKVHIFVTIICFSLHSRAVAIYGCSHKLFHTNIQHTHTHTISKTSTICFFLFSTARLRRIMKYVQCAGSSRVHKKSEKKRCEKRGERVIKHNDIFISLAHHEWLEYFLKMLLTLLMKSVFFLLEKH